MRVPLASGVVVVVEGRRFVLVRRHGRGVEAWETAGGPGPVARCSSFSGVFALVRDLVLGLGLDGFEA